MLRFNMSLRAAVFQRALRLQPTRLPKPMNWPDPTEEMLRSREFDAIWQCIKTWDIAVPEVYSGYCGATGNHVRAILDALRVELTTNE